MNRSHVFALLITVFALAVLGIAAGTLESARPAQTTQTTPGAPVTLHEQEESATQTNSPGGRPLISLALPDTDVTDGLTESGAQSGSVIVRLGLGIALLVAGGILVSWRLTSGDAAVSVTADDEAVSRVTEPEPSTPVGSPYDAPPMNDVYRAWQSMVSLLDPAGTEPQTPTELARTAVTAGLPEPAVQSVTDAFCAVRYGGKSPTDERERLARDALASIRQAMESASDEASACDVADASGSPDDAGSSTDADSLDGADSSAESDSAFLPVESDVPQSPPEP
ncbi:hypothetical protein C440_06767 [Haloferax mucosum ATCC BAA-1512]|uniref:Protein-glutamine gamma-glutamyltransferase-like C-terminal domain-containing protein n=1 Tax=Haloferax mucosum ATCC BAA-1512 TaxID=662479 RepID=M0IIW3_9EURY|nr:DUF4129 domain-containing protein [Haloferax mucosum]ELZ95972.1 hypothetical protein C440_06767 [Haloferax mucosum ATCC BAA-1512]